MSTIQFACTIVADVIVSGAVAFPIANGIVWVADRIEGRWR